MRGPSGAPIWSSPAIDAKRNVLYATTGDNYSDPATRSSDAFMAMDLDSGIAGAETSVTRYATGCAPGGHAELWTINGGSHLPSLSAAFAPDLIDFLFAHPKP